jgi:hypothetical protein
MEAAKYETRKKIVVIAAYLSVSLMSLFLAETLTAFYFSKFSSLYYVPNYLRLAPNKSFWAMLTEYKPWGAWHKVNASGTHKTPCFNLQYTTNSLGARDSEKSPAGTSSGRTIFVGDSFIEGYGVDTESRLSNLLEQWTNRESLNLGSSGSLGPLQYWMVYNNFSSSFDHSNVVVGFFPNNDFTDNDPSYLGRGESWKNDNYRYRPYYQKNGSEYRVFYKGSLQEGRTFIDFRPDYVLSSVKVSLLENTWLYGLYLAWNGWLPKKQLDFIAQSENEGYFENSSDRIDAAFYFLRKLTEEARNKNVYILIIPTLNEALALRTRTSPWIEEFKKMFSSPAVRVIDLGPLFSALPDPDLKAAYLGCDGHWSSFGNKVAFDFLSKSFQK